MKKLEANAKAPSDPRDWNPPFCGDIDIEIRHDGSWWYKASAITRFELQCLFARILCYENGDYFLVTPVEKMRIHVADVPFIVTACDLSDDTIVLHNNVAESLTLAYAGQLIIAGDADRPRPYVAWRDGLRARLSHAVYYELCEHALQQPPQNGVYGVYSNKLFFPLMATETAA